MSKPNESKRRARPRRSISWFSGADPELLAECGSEQNFYRRLGAAVLLLSCLSGVAMAFGLAYVLDADPADLWWAGAGWAVFLACGVEPLVLQLSPTRNWAALGLAVSWRLALSLLLALQLSEPIILAINEPEINRQLQIERRDAKAEVIADAKATFEPKIEADRDELRATRGRVLDLQHKVARYDYLAGSVEAGACGPACQRYQELAAQGRQHLQAVSARNRHRQRKLRQQLGRWRGALRQREAEGIEAVEEGDGIWARMRAMDAIASRGGEQAAEVWALRALLLVLDLLPLTAKLFRLATVDSPYEARLASRRKRDRLEAEREDAETDVRESEIRGEARRAKEVKRAWINRETDRELADIEGGVGAAGSRDRGGDRVPAWNLREYAGIVTHQEAEPVPVPAELTRVGYAGAAILGALLLLAVLVAALGGGLPAGTPILALAFVGIAALGAYTHGFRRANAWGLRAILASFLVALALPPFLLLINV